MCNPKTMFKCRRSEGCIARKELCNDVQNCPDGSDELGCTNNTGTNLDFLILKYQTSKIFLAHQIMKSYILPYVRNSYLIHVISPQAHPVLKCSFLSFVV